MVDLTQLLAAEMAAQLSCPTGSTGVAVGDYMSKINGNLIKATYQHLAPMPQSRILEIGFGNGKLIGDLLNMAPGSSYVGVDMSDTMVSEARRSNQTLIERGRVALHLGSVERLPFPDAEFDRALSVNTIYFWPNPLAALIEIRRVLSEHALLVLASMTPETSAKSAAARPEHGFRVPARDALVSLHRQSGFADVDCSIFEEEATRLDGTLFHRCYHMVVART